jgi:hypothetical protein
MKQFNTLSALLLPFLLLSCGPSESSDDSSPPPVPKEITASERNGNSGDRRDSTYSSESGDGLDVGPLIDLDEQFLPVKIINQNLDLEQTDEQIIFGKMKDDPDGEIMLKLLDFDEISNEYVLSWEAVTHATNVRTFIISFIDIIGDHKLEILCSGIDKQGLRSLDIYRQTFSPSGVGLYYTSICSITADGSIDIHEYERSQAYKQGQRNGRSFPIITFSQDKDADNIMDLVREEYYWKYQENRYVKGKVEYIPGKIIEATQLRELFTKDTTAFEEYLAGPWIMSGPEDENQQATIFFNPDEGQIIFFSRDIQELYEWESSHRTRIPNSIYISVTNKMVPFIKKYVSIYVESMDVIKIEINDRDFTKSNFMWDGTFTRLHDSAQEGILTDAKYSHTANDLSSGEVRGEYKNSFGGSILFAYPFIEMTTDTGPLRGKYSMYDFEGDTILDIMVLSESNTVTESKLYLLEQTIDSTEQITIYKLTLTPGKIGVSGFQPSGDTSRLYVRYERKDAEEDREASGEE